MTLTLQLHWPVVLLQVELKPLSVEQLHGPQMGVPHQVAGQGVEVLVSQYSPVWPALH